MNIPQPPRSARRKEVAPPLPEETKGTLGEPNPEEDVKVTLRLKAESATWFKIEAARRRMTMIALFEEMKGLYEEKRGG